MPGAACHVPARAPGPTHHQRDNRTKRHLLASRSITHHLRVGPHRNYSCHPHECLPGSARVAADALARHQLADDGRTSATPASAGHRLPGGGMTTRLQAPVAVTPPLPTRRNAELLLLCFAAVITFAALLVVQANQDQGVPWDLTSYGLAFLTLFGSAHLAIRRFAPYTDPLLLPVVALLNGLGLVMIHRLDLVDNEIGEHRHPSANQQMLWTLVGVAAFALVVTFLKDHRQLARYGYICGLAGLVFLAVPALLPAALSEQNGAKIWIRLPGFSIQPAEFSKILLLIFFSAVLVAKRGLFTSAGKHLLGMTLPRPRDLAPLLAAWVISVGVMVFEKDLGASLLLYTSFLVVVYLATQRFSWVVIGLTLFAAGTLVAYFILSTSGSAYRPGWIRSQIQTAPDIRSCSRFSASLQAVSSAPGSVMVNPTPCPRHPPISSSPRSAKSLGWWA